MGMDGIVEKLKGREGVFDVCMLTDELFKEFLKEESSVEESSMGMPLVNEALKECLHRNSHLAVFSSGSFDMPQDHVMVMKDDEGHIVGHDVPKGMMEMFQEMQDVIWLCDDFVMFPSVCAMSEISMHMLPQRLTIIDEGDGAGNPVVLYPATTSDMLLKRMFSIPLDSKLASAIISFDLL